MFLDSSAVYVGLSIQKYYFANDGPHFSLSNELMSGLFPE